MMRQGKTARLSGFLPRCQMMDLDLNPYPCDISGYPEPSSSVLDDFEAIVTEHLLAGISRREKKNSAHVLHLPRMLSWNGINVIAR